MRKRTLPARLLKGLFAFSVFTFLPILYTATRIIFLKDYFLSTPLLCSRTCTLPNGVVSKSIADRPWFELVNSSNSCKLLTLPFFNSKWG